MTGDKDDLTSGEILLDTSAGASFTVPAGSYPYTVDVNQTLGDWDATNVLMKDTLDSDKMQYTGYAKVEALIVMIQQRKHMSYKELSG